MKSIRLHIVLVILLFTSFFSFAQRHTPNPDDIAKAMKGGRVSLRTNKALLEAKESAVLNLKLIVPMVNQETGDPEGMAYEINLPDGSDPNIPAAYTPGNWRIVEGGGTISGIEATQCVYTAPATEPAGKVMTISVDLVPTSNALPKLELLVTIYFVDNPVSIVVNLPEGGYPNVKFAGNTGGGFKMTTQGMDPRAAAHMDPALQAQLVQAQAAVAAAGQSKGIDLAAMASNATAYYDPEKGITIVKLINLNRQMSDGKDVRTATAPAYTSTICELSYKGTGLGQHALSDNTSEAALMEGNIGCFCGNNRNTDSKYPAPCNGYVNITSIEKGIMKGNFQALTYTYGNGALVRGYIYGKFTANVANR